LSSVQEILGSILITAKERKKRRKGGREGKGERREGREGGKKEGF
jgi:hypothetical protein